MRTNRSSFFYSYSLHIGDLSVYIVDPISELLNTLPNNKIVDWSKLKAFADRKIDVTEKLKFVLGRLENIVGKGEIACQEQFVLFLTEFSKELNGRQVKTQDCLGNA